MLDIFSAILQKALVAGAAQEVTDNNGNRRRLKRLISADGDGPDADLFDFMSSDEEEAAQVNAFNLIEEEK